MYINTFKYTPADVDCKLCTEYVKKFGCTACGCPWMAERIEAGVVGYAEVVRQMFPHDKRLMARLEPLIRDFPGMLWPAAAAIPPPAVLPPVRPAPQARAAPPVRPPVPKRTSWRSSFP